MSDITDHLARPGGHPVRRGWVILSLAVGSWVITIATVWGLVQAGIYVFGALRPG